MEILFIGDIVGSSGRRAVKRHLENNSYDFVIANVENSASGFGITDRVYHELKNAGVNAMTAGNHTWDKKDAEYYIDSWDIFVRPANLGLNTPGKGVKEFTVCGRKIYVINLLGRVYMNLSNDPFEKFDEIYNGLDKDGIVIVDFHGEATAEKIAFGMYADGRANVVTGTHTHVQTNDLCLLENSTLYLTDAGMCGTKNSVLGMDKESSIERFVKYTSRRLFVETRGSLMFNGFTFSINSENIVENYRLINEIYEEKE